MLSRLASIVSPSVLAGLCICHRFSWVGYSIKKLCRIGVLTLIALVLHGCISDGKSLGADSSLVSSGARSAEDLFALTRKANTAYKSSQWLDAAELYRELLEKLPEDPYVWFRLGNTLTHLGQFQQAIYAFESSLAKDERQPKPWFNLSTTYLLGAQLASMRAMERLSVDDPARGVMQNRLIALENLLP